MFRILGATVLVLAGAACVARASEYSDFNAGVSASTRDEPDAAIRYLTAALSGPGLPTHLRATAFLARGDQYLEKKQFDAALADFAEAIRLDPTRPDGYIDRCNTYSAEKDYQSALKECSGAVQLQPQNWTLRNLRIRVYFEMKDYDSILSEYSGVISQRPDDAELLTERATVFLLKGDFPKAHADAAASRNLDSQRVAPLVIQGQADFIQGDFPGVIGQTNAAFKLTHDIASQSDSDDGVPGNSKKYSSFLQWYRAFIENRDLMPYAFLWHSIAQAKLHQTPSAETISRVTAWKFAGWPGPLVRLYLGNGAPEAALGTPGYDIDSGEAVACIAQFYVGEWYDIHGDPANAKRLLQSAADLCGPRTVMRPAALAALSRLQ